MPVIRETMAIGGRAQNRGADGHCVAEWRRLDEKPKRHAKEPSHAQTNGRNMTASKMGATDEELASRSNASWAEGQAAENTTPRALALGEGPLV